MPLNKIQNSPLPYKDCPFFRKGNIIHFSGNRRAAGIVIRDAYMILPVLIITPSLSGSFETEQFIFSPLKYMHEELAPQPSYL